MLLAGLLDPVNANVAWSRASWAVATSRALDSPAFFRFASAASSFAFAPGQLRLEGFLVDDEEELARLDVAAFLEVDLLEEPAHPGPDRDLLEGAAWSRSARP